MKYLTPPTSGAIQKTQVSGRAFNLDKVVEFNREDRRRVSKLQKMLSDADPPRGVEGAGTIIDILGDDSQICVDFTQGLGEFSGQRDCKFSDALWEEYGEKFHYHQLIHVFGVTSNKKEPITVLEVRFYGDSEEPS